MPVIRAAGNHIQLASDIVPLLAGVGVTLQAVWFITVGSLLCASAPGACTGSPGARQYDTVWIGALALLGAALLLDASLIALGLRGAPFEVSKRRAVAPLLCASIVLLAAQTGFNGYATWVVAATPLPPCYQLHSRGAHMRALVGLTWAYVALSWARLTMAWSLLTLFPVLHNMASWRRRMQLLMFVKLPRSAARDIKQQLNGEGKQPLKQHMQVIREGFRGLALAPSDVGVGLVLLAALQRRRRGIHISALLRPNTPPPATTLPELRAARGTSMRLTGLLEDHLERMREGRPANAVAALASFQEHRSAAGSVQCGSGAATVSIADDGMRDMLQPHSLHHASRAFDAAPDSGQASHMQPTPTAAQAASDISAVACCSDSSSSLGRRPPQCSALQGPDGHEDESAACLAEGQMQQLTDGGGADATAPSGNTRMAGGGPALQGAAPTVTDSMGGGHAMGRLERQLTKMASSLNHGKAGMQVDAVTHEIASQGAANCLMPSSIAAELRPDLEPDEAAATYAGEHQQVDLDTLQQAMVFAKYAAAAYSATLFENWPSLWPSLWPKGCASAALPMRAWLVKAAFLARHWCSGHKDHDQVGNQQQRLNHEAVIQYTGTDHADLLYMSDSNQALGAVPYVVMLDHASDSVVVSLRGSCTMADWATNLVAAPAPLDAWLPDAFQQEYPDLGPCFAHSGMLAAARAVWADLQEHGILQVLLSAEADSAASRGKSRPPVQPTDLAADTAGQQSPASDVDRNTARSAAAESAAGLAGAEPKTAAPGAQPSSPSHSAYAAAIRSRGLHHREWKLVVTGHSMGAGVAALLSLKLRYLFPDVRCWAFNPPGALVSVNLSAVMSSFCTSVITGKDLVSRGSVHNLAAVLDELLVALSRCKQPTCKVLLKVSRRKWRWRNQAIDQLLHAPEDVPPEALQLLTKYQEQRYQLKVLLEQLPAMQPPGRAMFLRRLKAKIDPVERRAREAAAREAEERARRAEEAAAREAQGLGPPTWRDSIRHSLRRGAHNIGGPLPQRLRRLFSAPLSWSPEPGDDDADEDGGSEADELWAHQEAGAVKHATAAKAAAAAGHPTVASSHGRLQRPTAVPEDTEAAMPSAVRRMASAYGSEAPGGRAVSNDESDVETGTGNNAKSPSEEDKVTYERRWDAVWIDPREVINEGILVSPRMISDHYPPTLIGALQAVLAGGRESGTREQRVTSMQPAPFARIDRLMSLARRGSS